MTDESTPRHARTSTAPPRGPAVVLVAVVVAVASTATGVYADLRGRIDVSDVSDLVAAPAGGTELPTDPFAGAPMNVLVMGTDLRDAENAALAGAADGLRSDSTMLVHVAADRTWAEVVSIPRDSLVDVPACRLPGGGESEPRRTMFNEAFSIGAGSAEDLDHAAACTISTVQALTGVTVTHHVVVRMTGVIDVVDALGGVRMCLPEPVTEDPEYGGLALPAGDQRLDGTQAIGFLRVRHGEGMGLETGSDLTRIQRQQAFLQSAVRELLGKDVLTDGDELYRVARSVLGALSADPQLADPVRLAAFGYSLRGMDRARVVFTEVPVVDAPSDPNRVVWTADADPIWQRIAADTPPDGIATPATSAPAVEAGAGADDGGTSAGGEAGAGDVATDAGTDPSADAADPATTDPAAGGTGADPLGDALLPGVCTT